MCACVCELCQEGAKHRLWYCGELHGMMQVFWGGAHAAACMGTNCTGDGFLWVCVGAFEMSASALNRGSDAHQEIVVRIMQVRGCMLLCGRE